MTTIDAFTKRTPTRGPKATFSLVLASVTIATVAMWIDGVPTFSHAAFYAGVILALGLALVLGTMIEALARRPGRRGVAAVLLPAAFGAIVGMAVQAIVLGDASPPAGTVLKDLGGAVDTASPISWIASGILLGGVPALGVSVFLLLAVRAIRRIGGHDASEHFGVYFTGACGISAALSANFMGGGIDAAKLVLVPLFGVTTVSFVTLLSVLLIDGARMRLVRRVYAGEIDDLEVVPKERFADDPSLAPMISAAEGGAVLVRVDRGASYRAASATPLALVSEHAFQMLRPLVGRRFVTVVMLGLMGVFLALCVTRQSLPFFSE
jgi:hypothetical protein